MRQLQGGYMNKSLLFTCMVLFTCIISSVLWVGCGTRFAEAHHDKIYTPCDTETGHIHMSYEEVVARISIMEQDGTIPAGMISRYVEARDGGKGNEDPRRVWARNLEEGQILSLGNWASGHHPELEQLMFSSGLVAEWQLDANKTVRRFNDPYWRQPNPLSPAFTVWQTLCMANLNYSIPMFEEVEGKWISNVPTVTTIATTPVASATIATTPVASATIPTIPVVNATTPVVSTNNPLTEPVFSVNERLSESSNSPETTSLTLTASHLTASDWTERWFEAEWNDFPFEETIKLLEERYPPNTLNKYHFRLSTAVEFLRQGGKLKGLDNVWNS